MADDNKLVKWTGEQKDWKGYSKQKKSHTSRFRPVTQNTLDPLL